MSVKSKSDPQSQIYPIKNNQIPMSIEDQPPSNIHS